MPRTTTLLSTLLLLALAGLAPLSGGVALLVGEPIGRIAFFTPTGHAAVYLSRVCAESPTVLRRCRPGEPGAVISRYRLDIAPGDEPGEVPKGDWMEVVGAAYVRNLHGFYLPTTPEEDDRLIDHLNSMENRGRFNLLYRNCADFARRVVNFYYPGTTRRNILADLGISTPKGAARSLVKYSRKHPDLPLSHFVVSQIPGSRPSTKTRGVTESLIRSKKYAVPLAVFQPWVAVGAAAAYVSRGRFDPSRMPHAACEPTDLTLCLETADDATPGS